MQSKRGFLMVEVLVSIFILMFTTVNIINLQFRALYRAADDRDEIMHLFKLKKELYNMLLFPEKKHFKNKIVEEDSELTILKEQRDLEQKSSLSPLKKQLASVIVDGKWKFNNNDRSSRLSGIIYNYNQEEKRA
ncbi:hypothetical protein JKY79_02775 [Candidatus Babeliales bacterium]|nr:hypothetical protein [Candidatus Babeliales bacterium]